MRRLIFATNNKHKVTEVRAALSSIDDIEIVTLADAGLHGEIPETADTLQGNALQKALWVWERTHTDCFADDTGLEVEAQAAHLASTPQDMPASTVPLTTTSTNSSPPSTAKKTAKPTSAPSSASSKAPLPTTHYPLPTTSKAVSTGTSSPPAIPTAKASATTPSSCPTASPSPSPKCHSN